mmetsp:Transcript_43225/g.57196  ORF Transcript_43225/g.57196 Transcript_43225/m.57196 type:complete len:92 (+) Transcript_43225:12-287(+)
MVEADNSGANGGAFETDGGMIAELDRRRSFAEGARECNRFWAMQFNLDRTMADQQGQTGAGFDFDDLLAFIEIVTRDSEALAALGRSWDAR